MKQNHHFSFIKNINELGMNVFNKKLIHSDKETVFFKTWKNRIPFPFYSSSATTSTLIRSGSSKNTA